MHFRRRTASVWADQHARAFADFAAGRIDAEDCWRLRVEATWGLIAEGAKALPFAIEMLNDPSPDVREDAAGVLAEIGKDDAVVVALLASLDRESDEEPRDAIVQALGRLQSQQAIPSLARLIRDPMTDGDTRSMATAALGSVVGRRFERQPDPTAAALAWLEKHQPDSESV